MNSSNNSSYKWVIYRFNPETGFYNKTISQPENYAVNSLPYELKREEIQGSNIKPNANEGLFKRSYNTKGSRNVLTGLQQLGVNNWFVGNVFYKGKTSLLIVHFTPDNENLYLFLYSGYDKVNSYQRQKYAVSQLPILVKRIQDQNNSINL
jgi:hypothetical protein